MLHQLKLNNFKCHEELVVDFSAGLQVLRGKNEAGKSTIFHAIAYALYGSRALPESLEETVRWEQPLSSLRVELTFSVAGKQYNIVRKNSGAELVGPDVKASGQANVTAFVETLFGANAAVGQATLLVSQKALEDGLRTGSVGLIEKLANIGLMDDLINGIQTKLPSGNTKVLEERLNAAKAVPEPALSASGLAEFDALIAAYNQSLQEADTQRTELESMRQARSLERANLQGIAEANRKVKLDIARLEKDIAATRPRIVEVIEPPELADLPRLRELQKGVAEAEAVCRTWAQFTSLPEQERRAADAVQTQQTEANQRLADIDRQLAEVGAAIKHTQQAPLSKQSCDYCGKDLSEVPEFVAAQEARAAQLLELQNRKETLTAERAATVSHLQDAMRFVQANYAFEKLIPKKLVEVDRSTLPVTVRWIGPNADEVQVKDHSQEIKRLEALERQYKTHLADVQAARVKLEVLEPELEQVKARLLPFDVRALEAVETSLNRLTEDLGTLAGVVENAKSALRQVERQKQADLAAHAQALGAYEAAKKEIESLEGMLQAYNKHNTIIKKLRDIRPLVAKELWSLVLSGVSHYFSNIRGVQSTVTRDESMFRIDGKPFTAYSGSTKDSLGLAVRIMNQKTFLPNVDFMLVDEPGASFDDTREQEMLATLASCGLAQVVLVTHSDLADSFAANVIQI